MEYDINLKHFLVHDNEVVKKEAKLSLDFLKCKIENCYSNSRNNITKITHEDFEDCKEKCVEKFQKFNLMREYLYMDYSNFYYQKYLNCSTEFEDEKYNKCLNDNQKLMRDNIEQIKKIVLNYNY